MEQTITVFVPQLSFQKHPTDGQGEEEPPFLLPPPLLPRLPSVPTSTNPQWRPESLHWCHQQNATCFQTCIPKWNARGAGKIFKRPAQRKSAKGNGAPQSAYPVSAAFNRMLLMHRFLYLWGVNRKKAVLGENPLKCLQLLWLQKMLFFISILSALYQKGGSDVKIEISE